MTLMKSLKLSFLLLTVISLDVSATSKISLAGSECQQEYLDLFAKPVINVTAAFGYFDIGNNKVADYYKLKFFIKKLTDRCENWDQKMCEFKLQSKNPYVLTRNLFGPDGKMRTVRITTDASSVSPDDAANRKNPEQKIQSEKMEKLFHEGLKNSEITLYMGHSRNGGGPDFSPPRLDASGHTDYTWYQRHQVNKNKMTEVLGQDPGRSRVIGLISCSSVRWFSKNIAQDAPASGIVATDNTYYVTNFEENLKLLENVFSYKCLKDFSIADARKQAKFLTNKQWKMTEENKNLTQAEIDQRTLKELAQYLRSPNRDVQQNALREIMTYDPALHPLEVRQELANYKFGRAVFNSLIP
jgi:hypothetical protein